MHCDGEGRRYRMESGWSDCVDCAGSGEAAMDPFDPIHRAAAAAGIEARYRAEEGLCVDCGAPAYSERDGMPRGMERCRACGDREAAGVES